MSTTTFDLILIVLGGIGAGVGAFLAFKAKDSRFWGTLAKLYAVMGNLIDGAGSKLQPSIQAARADGTVTKDELDRLIEEAWKLAKEELGQELLATYQRKLGKLAGPIEMTVKGIAGTLLKKQLAPPAAVVAALPAVVAATNVDLPQLPSTPR